MAPPSAPTAEPPSSIMLPASLSCVFPDLIDDQNVSCDEMGIIASVAGIGGLFQANLALNYILGLRRNFKEFVLFDSVYLELKKISVKKNPVCKICS